tara:strand:+ start:324 stop:725 length:402 start_codon:yes stop_codon:yes gene_type:complete
MANGTIAFDTLSTSGQISGTAVSVDTDYLAYGSAKAWYNLIGTGTAALRDSFNISGITDNGTGSYTGTFSSNMGNDDYAGGVVDSNNADVASAVHTRWRSGGIATSSVESNTYYNGAVADPTFVGVLVNGDLA